MRPMLRVLIGSPVLVALASAAIGQPTVRMERPIAPPSPTTAPIVYHISGSQFSNSAVSVIEMKVQDSGPGRQSPWRHKFHPTTPMPPQSMSREPAIPANAVMSFPQAGLANEKYGLRSWQDNGQQIESHSSSTAHVDPQGHWTIQTIQPSGRSDYRGGTFVVPRAEVIRSNEFQPGSEGQKRRLVHILSETEMDLIRHLEQTRTSSGAPDPSSPSPAAIDDELDPNAIINRRPVVYHAGNLPPGIPDWFAQLDTDHDGQVGLYEWKVNPRPITEFHGMDRNGDGLLTIRELMFFMDSQSGNAKSARSTKP